MYSPDMGCGRTTTTQQQPLNNAAFRPADNPLGGTRPQQNPTAHTNNIASTRHQGEPFGNLRIASTGCRGAPPGDISIAPTGCQGMAFGNDGFASTVCHGARFSDICVNRVPRGATSVSHRSTTLGRSHRLGRPHRAGNGSRVWGTRQPGACAITVLRSHTSRCLSLGMS